MKQSLLGPAVFLSVGAVVTSLTMWIHGDELTTLEHVFWGAVCALWVTALVLVYRSLVKKRTKREQEAQAIMDRMMFRVLADNVVVHEKASCDQVREFIESLDNDKGYQGVKVIYIGDKDAD